MCPAGCETSRQRGVTLPELLTAVTVLAVFVRFAIPAAADLANAVAVSSAASEFTAYVQLARSEALKRNGRVVMCKADHRGCVASGGWEQGWIVYDDMNNSGSVDNGEEVIARHGPLSGGLVLNGNQPVARYISYTSIGATKLASGGFQAGTLTVCRRSAGTSQAVQIVLNSVGRPRVQKKPVGSCP